MYYIYLDGNCQISILTCKANVKGKVHIERGNGTVWFATPVKLIDILMNTFWTDLYVIFRSCDISTLKYKFL